MEEEQGSIILIDDEGKEIEFDHLMTLDIKDNTYVVLTPIEEIEEMEEDEVIILKVQKDEDDNDVYVSIEDEQEVEEVFEAFNEVYESQLDN